MFKIVLLLSIIICSISTQAHAGCAGLFINGDKYHNGDGNWKPCSSNSGRLSYDSSGNITTPDDQTSVSPIKKKHTKSLNYPDKKVYLDKKLGYIIVKRNKTLWKYAIFDISHYNYTRKHAPSTLYNNLIQ